MNRNTILFFPSLFTELHVRRTFQTIHDDQTLHTHTHTHTHKHAHISYYKVFSWINFLSFINNITANTHKNAHTRTRSSTPCQNTSTLASMWLKPTQVFWPCHRCSQVREGVGGKEGREGTLITITTNTYHHWNFPTSPLFFHHYNWHHH